MLSKKRAISTVLTTIIILVSSVVLGSGVVLYGTSLFQSGTQTESITVFQTKLWVHADADEGLAWGGTAVRNTGDTVLSINKIQVRGADIPFTQWYPDTTVTSSVFQQALNHSGWSGADGELTTEPSGGAGICTTTLIQDVTGSGIGDDQICAEAATGPISLNPGSTTVIYFQLTNGTLSALDSGLNISVNIVAGKSSIPHTVAVVGRS